MKADVARPGIGGGSGPSAAAGGPKTPA